MLQGTWMKDSFGYEEFPRQIMIKYDARKRWRKIIGRALKQDRS